MKRILIPTALSLLVLSACEPLPQLDNGQYWQRINASESIYMRGPKAQQTLNKDIGGCVTTLRELERLGQLKDTIPTDYHGRVLNPSELDMYEWDSPERDGAMLAEMGDYYDFESCMRSKGWERIQYVPYKISQQAKENYRKVHVRMKSHDEMTDADVKKKYSSPSDFDELNE